MDQAEKVAYRRILADSVILIRGYSGPAYQRSSDTCQPALRHVNAIADLFHNLAACSCEDLSDFKPDQFWQQFSHYRKLIPELHDFETSFRNYKEKEI